MNTPKSLYYILFFITAALSFNLCAQNGFDDPIIIAILKRNTEKTGLTPSEAIDEAMDAVSWEDWTRIMITTEGEIIFSKSESLLSQGQLFAVVGVSRAQGHEVKALVCSVQAAVLEKRTYGIAAFSDLISSKDALKDNFLFNLPANPREALGELLQGYADLEPANKSIKRKKTSSPMESASKAVMNLACSLKM